MKGDTIKHKEANETKRDRRRQKETTEAPKGDTKRRYKKTKGDKRQTETDRDRQRQEEALGDSKRRQRKTKGDKRRQKETEHIITFGCLRGTSLLPPPLLPAAA